MRGLQKGVEGRQKQALCFAVTMVEDKTLSIDCGNDRGESQWLVEVVQLMWSIRIGELLISNQQS